MKSGLLKKLLLFLLLTLFVNALLTAGVFTFTSRNVFANIKAKEIIPRARGLSEIMSQYQRGEITTRTLEILMNMTLDKSMWDASVHIYPGDGTWLSRAATFEGEEALGALHAYLPDILNGETNLLVTATADLGIVVGTPIYGVDAEVTGAVFLTKQLTEVNTALSGLNSALVISVLMVLCVMVVTAYFGSRSFTRPLLQMSKAAQAMAKGDFSVRADAHENDEVGQLGKSLNELSEALSQTIGALVLERNRLQSVLDGLREGIIAVDAGGRITHCNPAAARLLGAKKGDDGLALARLTEVCPDILEEAGNGDLHYHAALMGDRRLQITVAGLLGQKNRHAGAVALIQDITEQTRLEQTRRDYVANVSHELRTPIASIRSIADSLHDGMVKKEE
ncbi:MAG: cell wall metabolism sensor histidine kinase WalK, partial [Clostridiales bacterium]|nr:cell wall metabolism sensor histidine kinase WalK [Clostridiales bacterium]